MDAFLQPLLELEELQEAKKQVKSSGGIVQISGCIDAQKSHMIYGMSDGFKHKIIVTFSEQKARELYEDYRFFDPDVVYYPAKDVLFYQSDIRGNVLTAERLSALKTIHEKDEVTVITTFDALMNTMAPIEKMWENVLTLEQGQLLDLKEMPLNLIL